MRTFNFAELPAIAAANGAATPAPSYASQCFAWSSTLARPVVWDGAAWQRLALMNDAVSRTGDAGISGALVSASLYKSTSTGGGAIASFVSESITPTFAWRVTNGATDSKVWDITADSSSLGLRLVNDANNGVTPVMTVARTGMTVTGVTFGPQVTAPQLAVNSGGSGLIYFGTGTSNYLYWNGSTFYFGGGPAASAVNASADSSGNVSFMASNVGGANGAMIGFLRQGLYGIKMGLDQNNAFVLGGLSQGANVLRVYWDAAGNQVTTGSVTQFSDVRYKRGMVPIEDVQAKLGSIDAFLYTDEAGQRRIGVSAQSVQLYFPEAVLSDPATGRLSVAYGELALACLVDYSKDTERDYQAVTADIRAMRRRLDAIDKRPAGYAPLQVDKKKD